MIARSTILMGSIVQIKYTIPNKLSAIHDAKGKKKNGSEQFKTL
jgi:hypothetical protein